MIDYASDNILGDILHQVIAGAQFALRFTAEALFGFMAPALYYKPQQQFEPPKPIRIGYQDLALVGQDIQVDPAKIYWDSVFGNRYAQNANAYNGYIDNYKGAA